MSTASSHTFASYSQTVTQTTSFIGSSPAHGMCRDNETAGGFTQDLASFMLVPVVPVCYVPVAQVNVATGVGGMAGVGGGADSMMQLLQSLESEMAKFSGELQANAGQGASSCGGQMPASGLQGDYQTLYNEAAGAVQDGSSFDVTLPSGETLSGKFTWTEVEKAGDNSLFTPGDPGAPDAGKAAFDNALDQFLQLAQGDAGSTSAASQIANYNTSTSFTGGNSSISWSGSFSLAPADAIPKNG